MIAVVFLVVLLLTALLALGLGYVDLHRRRRLLRAEEESLIRRRREIQVTELALGAMVGELPRPLASVN
jgi:hypothetical protein